MTHKTFLFAALFCLLGWCCVSCESNEPSTTGGSSTYVAKGFSVSANKQVIFSPGNLQYQASTDTWRFANHQYDYVGELNEEISPTNENWIDLFGWGTGNNPTNTSEDGADYATFVDWGTNKIAKYKANTWRTLTKNEWEYLLFKRISAAAFWGRATVNNICGLILLPDDFTLPEDMTFVAGDGFIGLGRWNLNVYTTYEWEKMEKAGAVFLPASGFRYGSSIGGVQYNGHYWSATPDGSYDAYILSFTSSAADCYGYDRYYGHAVRLVQDL